MIRGFDAAYRGTPPWDIGRPQAAFAQLVETGALRRRVLDVGCGTGEHALLAARAGLEATGIDAAPAAIELAKRKAVDRNLTARFLVWDALNLAALGEQFDTILDCGLLHVFDDDDRSRFVEGLRAIAPTGAGYFMLCFSDRMPGTWGPRRVREDEIRTSFADGWRVESIAPAILDINTPPHAVPAWFSTITRI